MTLVDRAGYLAFLSKHRHVRMGDFTVRLKGNSKIETDGPQETCVENTNVWASRTEGAGRPTRELIGGIGLPWYRAISFYGTLGKETRSSIR